MDFLKKELQEYNIKPRLEKLYEFWDKSFGDVDALIINNGNDDLGNLKIKIIAIQSWLFKYELVETILVITKNSIILLGGEDMKLFTMFNEKMADTGIEFHLLTKTANLEENMTNILDLVKKGTKKSNNLKFGTF